MSEAEVLARVLYLLGGLVFVALLVGEATAPRRSERAFRRSRRAEARVTRVREYTDESGTVYEIDVEFVTVAPEPAAGTKPGTAVGRIDATALVDEETARGFSSGRRIPIRYDPESPHRVWLEPYVRHPVSVLGLGFHVVMAGVLFYLAVR